MAVANYSFIIWVRVKNVCNETIQYHKITGQTQLISLNTTM